MSRTTALGAFGGLFLAAFTPVLAQTSQLQRDVEFVRKLANELRFISLAQAEAEQLRTTYRDSSDFKQVLQLEIEISLAGARVLPPEERRTMYQSALEKSQDLIGRYSDDPVANQARRTLVQAAYEYGQFLLDEIELARDEAPDKLPELLEAADGVFRAGIDACDSVMSGLDAFRYKEGTPQQNELFQMWLYKGILQRERARSAPERDRPVMADLARTTLEELIFEAGEHTLRGQRAFFEYAKVGEVLGEFDAALSNYKDTIEIVKSALDEAQDIGLSREAQELMFWLLQQAYDAGAAVLFKQGRVDATTQFISEFRADLGTYGAQGAEPLAIAHPQYGHPVFLTEAQAMAESGNPELVGQALLQVQKINDLHPNDFIGQRAKAVLKDILEIQSSMVSGALLFEVAKGDFQAREYEKAAQGFKAAYAAMSPGERDESGLDLFLDLSRCFGIQQRPLEAVLAAVEGLERHGREGTETTQPEDLADVLEQAWNLYNRNAKNDADEALQPLREKVLQMLGEFGGEDSEAKLRWREGNQLLRDEKYADAVGTFAQVPQDTPYYEPAQGRIVVCWQIAGDFAKARKAIADYRAWLGTDAAALEGDQLDLIKNRKATEATMAFYDAYMDYLEATGQAGGSATDTTKYQPTIVKIQSFLSQHAENGPNYVARSYDMVARMYAELGQVAKAEEAYRTLRSKEPNSPIVPLLATAIFKAHYDSVKALETEYQTLESKNPKDPALTGVAKRLEDARRAALASGLDYLENATTPQYGVLYNTLSIASDLKEWKTVERVGRKVVELFANDATEGEKVEKFVTPALGEALLRQRNFRDAVPFLEAAAKANPNNYPVKRLLSLAQGGWYEYNDLGTLVEVNGLDQPKEAYQRHWTEYRKYIQATGVEQYSLEWYEFYWELFAFAARAANKGDSEMEGIRDSLYSIAASIDDFETLKTKRGKRGQELHGLFNSVRR